MACRGLRPWTRGFPRAPGVLEREAPNVQSRHLLRELMSSPVRSHSDWSGRFSPSIIRASALLFLSPTPPPPPFPSPLRFALHFLFLLWLSSPSARLLFIFRASETHSHGAWTPESREGLTLNAAILRRPRLQTAKRETGGRGSSPEKVVRVASEQSPSSSSRRDETRRERRYLRPHDEARDPDLDSVSGVACCGRSWQRRLEMRADAVENLRVIACGSIKLSY